jgi:hypothetical protein
MADYHLYFLRGNALVGSDHIQAESDDDAVRVARQRGSGDVVEVWNAEARVRIVATARSRAAAGGGTMAR